MQLIATCAFGLEKLLRDELKSLGLWIISTEDGRITFEGDEVAIMKANLNSRLADRIQIKIGEFSAINFDELFDETIALPWEDYIGENDQFPVDATSTKSILHSEPAIQSIVKKAVVKRLQNKLNTNLLTEKSEAIYQIHAKSNKDRFILSIDSSGDSLHKRGYRIQASKAPIKETLATCMIKLSDWDPSKILIDPFCGSGTIAIETAMIARNIAPGVKRSFAFQKWPWIPKGQIEKIKLDLVKAELKPTKNAPKIFAFDIDKDVIEIAKENAKRAGVLDMISFRCVDFNNLDFNNFVDATFVTNPPYGERMEEAKDVEKMYKALGQKFSQTKNCSLFLITSREDFPQLFGLRENKNRKLFNGNLKCYLYEYLPLDS
ncbi:MAG: class I SAM-dependent RNA methyltransferase [Candidatus Gracilibacteria bacterium]